MRTSQIPPTAEISSGRLLSRKLLSWYDRHRRRLPWRAEPGETPDPYRVWLSEVMLQQTGVRSVEPYFEAFLARWPRLADLAAADLDEVLHLWQGLGYYARARNLHACARTVTLDRNGRFPEEPAELRQLPGIGAYTAGAIAAIAFGRKAAAVDGNVERVLARLYRVEEPLPSAKPRLWSLAEGLVPEGRAGDFAQALMDLGATLCTPRDPDCSLCPWATFCRAHLEGVAASLPRRAPKKQKPLRQGVAFWLMRGDGAVLLRRRPEKGLLGGMMELPSTEWREASWTLAEARLQAPPGTGWRLLDGVVRHSFTHFDLELAVAMGRTGSRGEAEGIWVPPDRLADHALPTVMKKTAAHAVSGLGLLDLRPTR